MNFLAIAVAALIPAIVGFLYYNPKTVGTAWMNSLGKTEKELQEGFNMPVAMIVGLLMAALVALFVKFILVSGHPEGGVQGETFANNTFGHGVIHGLIICFFIIVPVLVTNGMYERKTWKNIFINIGYWMLTLALMGGLLDAWV